MTTRSDDALVERIRHNLEKCAREDRENFGDAPEMLQEAHRSMHTDMEALLSAIATLSARVDLLEGVVEAARKIDRVLRGASRLAMDFPKSDKVALRDAITTLDVAGGPASIGGLLDIIEKARAENEAVGVLVSDSMERNGPQVSSDIVRTYRALAAALDVATRSADTDEDEALRLHRAERDEVSQ